MKKLLALVLLLVTLPAFADKVVSAMAAQATNTAVTVDTTGYQVALVTVWAASGTPNGTVTVYSQPPLGAPPVALSTYATPTASKTFRGPVGAALVVALTGNSTGTVSVVVVLK